MKQGHKKWKHTALAYRETLNLGSHLAIFVFEIKRFHWPLHCPRVKMLGLRGQDSLKVWPIEQGEPKRRCNNLKTVHIRNRCMLDDNNYDLKVLFFGNNLSFVASRCYTCDLSTFKVRDFKFGRKYFKSFWDFFWKKNWGPRSSCRRSLYIRIVLLAFVAKVTWRAHVSK